MQKLNFCMQRMGSTMGKTLSIIAELVPYSTAELYLFGAWRVIVETGWMMGLFVMAFVVGFQLVLTTRRIPQGCVDEADSPEENEWLRERRIPRR